MAHFAELNENNEVIRVLVVNNSDINDPINQYSRETENIGIGFLKNLLGQETIWVQTSVNNNFRVRYASIGYTYNEVLDAFIPPKPYESWVINESTCDWEPPIPEPNDNNFYYWDESLYQSNRITGWRSLSPLDADH